MVDLKYLPSMHECFAFKSILLFARITHESTVVRAIFPIKPVIHFLSMNVMMLILLKTVDVGFMEDYNESMAIHRVFGLREPFFNL